MVDDGEVDWKKMVQGIEWVLNSRGVGLMDQWCGSGFGELVVVGENEFFVGQVFVEQLLLSIDSYVFVKEVNKIENEGEFVYKEMAVF